MMNGVIVSFDVAMNKTGLVDLEIRILDFLFFFFNSF